MKKINFNSDDFISCDVYESHIPLIISFEYFFKFARSNLRSPPLERGLHAESLLDQALPIAVYERFKL